MRSSVTSTSTGPATTTLQNVAVTLSGSHAAPSKPRRSSSLAMACTPSALSTPPAGLRKLQSSLSSPVQREQLSPLLLSHASSSSRCRLRAAAASGIDRARDQGVCVAQRVLKVEAAIELLRAHSRGDLRVLPEQLSEVALTM